MPKTVRGGYIIPSPGGRRHLYILKTNMLDLHSVTIGSTQPKELAQFYEKVFGKPTDMAGGGYFGWLVGHSFFSVGQHSETKGLSKDPARVILNFETDQVKAEFERIKNLGAMVIKEPYQMGGSWIATLADPDGNYFQLMTPWEDMSVDKNAN